MIVELLNKQTSMNINKNMQLTSLDKITGNSQINFDEVELDFDENEADFNFEV